MGLIKRAILFEGKAIVDLLDTTDIVQKAIEYHNLSDDAAKALGKVLSIGAFISASFKGKNDKLTIIIQGNGSGGKIVVSGDAGGKVRGYIENPKAMGLKTQDVVGREGYLNLIKDFGLKEPYNGISQLVNGSIDADFAYYFTASEQLPSAISLGVDVEHGICKKSAGIIVQPMPNCEEEKLVILEDIVSQLSDIVGLVNEKGLDGVLDYYFGHFDINILDDLHPYYECSCSEEKIKNVLISLGREEANKIIEKEGKIEVNCQFCNKKYIFDDKDIEQLFNGKNN